MARIPMVEPANEPPELAPVFEQLRKTRGRVPGMYRTLAHQPAILAAHRAYFHAVLDAGALPRDFKEKVAYKVARLCRSDYSSASHRGYALRHGVSEETLDAIDRSDYSMLDERDRVALAFAGAMVEKRGSVPDDLFDALNAYFSDSEIIELVALVGIMELASALGAVFQLTPD